MMLDPYYSDSFVTLYNADCRLAMEHVQADVLITDPPYGLNLGKHKGAKDKKKRELRKKSYADYDDTAHNFETIVVPAIEQALKICAVGAVFGVAPNIWSLPRPVALGACYFRASNARNPWGFQNLAPILLYGPAPHLRMGRGAKNTVLMSSAQSPKVDHPCPKPLQWMQWLVDLCSIDAETILDPFAGSGSTLVAAKMAGRRSIGIEMTESYCEIAAKRCAQDNLFPLKPDATKKDTQLVIREI